MNLPIKAITCTSLDELPTSTQIHAMSRGIRYEITFAEAIQPHRERIAEQWRNEFPHFSIGIYRDEPKLSIEKLITDQEIIDNQLFFEKCAIDYGVLARDLIFRLAEQSKVPITESFPFNLVHTLRERGQRKGTMGAWHYRFYEFKCIFIHELTKQKIEVALMYFFEFGHLDPDDFIEYIQTTIEYQPLPVVIYDNFYDDSRILNKMLELGLLEYVPCRIETRKGLVPKNRVKSDFQF
jgi:hypothetical protein